MTTLYKGVPTNVSQGTAPSTRFIADGDALASVNLAPGPKDNADYAAYIYGGLVAKHIVNLTDSGAVNAHTSNNAIVRASALGLWVVGGNTGLISTSKDGLTWTARTSNVTGRINSIGFNGTMLVAVTEDGEITTSTNGTTWTARTNPGTTPTQFTQVAWDATSAVWIAVSATSAPGYTVWSSDGITWHAVIIPSVTNLWGIASNGLGQFLVVGADGGTHNAWTTTNGLAYTAQAIAGLNTTCHAVEYSDALSAFLVMDDAATPLTALSSNNLGTSWNAPVAMSFPGGGPGLGEALKWNGRAFVFAQSTGNVTIQWSVDGVSWRGHNPVPFLPGALTLGYLGVDPETRQMLFGTWGAGHVFSSELWPHL